MKVCELLIEHGANTDFLDIMDENKADIYQFEVVKAIQDARQAPKSVAQLIFSFVHSTTFKEDTTPKPEPTSTPRQRLYNN